MNERALLLMAAAVLLASTSAMAEPARPEEATPAQTKVAKDHFLAGKKALDGKQWDVAVTELRASLESVSSPNARLELARALSGGGHLAEAWGEYGRTVEDAARVVGADNRYGPAAAAARKERAELEAKLAFVTVTVAHAPAGATLKAGGRAVPGEQWSDPIVVPAGAVDVVLADGAGQELARATVEAVAGAKTPVALDGQPPPPAPPAGARATMDTGDDRPDLGEHPAPPPAPPADRTHLRPYAYVAGGVGAAGLVTFGVFGLMNNATYNDVRGACHPDCPAFKQGEIDTGRTQQTIANVGLGVGLVGLAAGATLWFLSRPPAASTEGGAALVVGPGYLGLRGSL